MEKRALNIHESFAGNLAYKDTILWDAYTPRQFPVFRQKINELFREPERKSKESAPSKAMEKIRQAIYNSTISQTKYTNKNLLSTFILVTVAEGTTYRKARDATKFSVHLIVRTRKCMKNDDSTNCCMAFIDEQGNVYKNWDHFVETNCLPEGVALAPSKGIYKFEKEMLVLEAWITPSSSAVRKAALTADKVAGYGGLAAAAGTVAALGVPLIVPALPVLGVICAGTGAYSAIRSAWSLWSRNDHEQSIGLSDSSARGAWLGVASGALAVSSSVANRSLARLALAGKEVSLIREVVVDGMNISTMLLSGTGVANGILDLIMKYSDDEEVTTLDVLQIAASLAIFTHSAYNFRLASTIVAQTQASKFNAYRSELSNRQRKMFDKLTKETIRTQGSSKGKMDVIRLINEVPDKQYLNDLNKINKQLNKNNVRFTAGDSGHISLNDEIQVKADVLRSSVQHGIGENILEKVNQPIPNSHQTLPNQEIVNRLTQNAFSENSNTLINYCQTDMQIASSRILNREAFQDCVQNIIFNVGDQIARFLIQKSREFIEKYGQTIENYMKTKLHIEVVLWDMYRKCEQNLLKFTIEVVQKSMDHIFQLLLSFYKEMSYENPAAGKIRCKVCQGFYQICSI